MRRLAYPYARYLIKKSNLKDLGLNAKHFLEDAGFSITKYDEDNEDSGILVIGVNKTVLDYLKQKKPMGHLQEFFLELTSFFDVDVTPLRDIDEQSQRVGVELYFWPFKKGVLMEVFILPYMELMNRAEHCRLIHHPQEEITDWYLCEETWEHLKPKIENHFQVKPIVERAPITQ